MWCYITPAFQFPTPQQTEPEAHFRGADFPSLRSFARHSTRWEQNHEKEAIEEDIFEEAHLKATVCSVHADVDEESQQAACQIF